MEIVIIEVMEIFFTKPWLRVFSGLFVNFAAGWFALVFITLPLIPLSFDRIIFELTKDIFFGTLCLVAAARIERILET